MIFPEKKKTYFFNNIFVMLQKLTHPTEPGWLGDIIT